MKRLIYNICNALGWLLLSGFGVLPILWKYVPAYNNATKQQYRKMLFTLLPLALITLIYFCLVAVPVMLIAAIMDRYD